MTSMTMMTDPTRDLLSRSCQKVPSSHADLRKDAFSVSLLPLLWEPRGVSSAPSVASLSAKYGCLLFVLTLTLIRCQARTLTWHELEGTK